MATQSFINKFLDKNNNKSGIAMATNQEIVSRSWKFDSIFKVLAGIIYGFFFGMLPASFIFNNSITSASNVSIFEICAIVGLFAIGIFSFIFIFWLFKGEIKRTHPFSYAIVHFVNGFLLSLCILIPTILAPNSNDDKRYLIFAIGLGVWALLMIVLNFIVLWRYKKEYPLTWSRIAFSSASFLFLGVTQYFTYLAKTNARDSFVTNQSTFLLIVTLASFIISLLVFVFGVSYIKRYRDILLGERTQFEIYNIIDWESARVSSIVISAATIITYSAALLWNEISKLSIAVYLEIIIDLLLVVPYLSIILYVKIKNMKNKNKAFYSSKIFRSIDNGLLLDFFAWIIVVKTVLIQGVLLVDNPTNTENFTKSLILIISFASIALLYGLTTIFSINVPNLKNIASSLPTIVMSILLGLFTILFGGYLQKEEAVNVYIYVFLPLFSLIGMSISTIIKILTVAKIYTINPNANKEIDEEEEFIANKYLYKTQSGGTIDLEKTTEANYSSVQQPVQQENNNDSKTEVDQSSGSLN
ncbi:MAG: hypothetical protein IJ970_01790 [Mycoplasmataceae bacterium]|nr:hypothetical protein [Mycoplasmataceae bacterium]